MSTPPDLSADRFRRLHSAQRVITSDLDLDTMLERVVLVACDVLDVQYATLAVLAPDGSLEHLVHHGPDDAVAERLVARRTGREIAQAMQEPIDSVHCRDVRCVDVRIGDELYAQLHVAAPTTGQFTDEDDALIAAMASSVGAAVEHAQLFDRASRSTEWLHASGEIARALLADADDDLFAEIVERAVTAADGDYGQLVIPTMPGDLLIVAAAGVGADELRDTVAPADGSDLARAVVNAKTIRLSDVTELLPDEFDNRHRYAAVMVAPLIDAQGTRGSIMITRVAGRPAFTDYELDLFATYAAQVALAMQFADARADAARMQVLETRHDTARELHDVVMQRLFATGVGMDTLASQLTDAAQAAQLNRHVHELDDTIEQIRAQIFGLRDDAQSLAPAAIRFPRLALNAAVTARNVGTPGVRSAMRRGRRRTDWHDGTGRRQA